MNPKFWGSKVGHNFRFEHNAQLSMRLLTQFLMFWHYSFDFLKLGVKGNTAKTAILNFGSFRFETTSIFKVLFNFQTYPKFKSDISSDSVFYADYEKNVENCKTCS